MRVQIPHGKGNFDGRKGRPILKYRDYRPCASAMRPFVKLLWPLVQLITKIYLSIYPWWDSMRESIAEIIVSVVETTARLGCSANFLQPHFLTKQYMHWSSWITPLTIHWMLLKVNGICTKSFCQQNKLVSHPTRHKIGHRSANILYYKLNLTQLKQTAQEQNSLS